MHNSIGNSSLKDWNRKELGQNSCLKPRVQASFSEVSVGGVLARFCGGLDCDGCLGSELRFGPD